MTRVLDILEDYCWFRNHKYRRIDSHDAAPLVSMHRATVGSYGGGVLMSEVPLYCWHRASIESQSRPSKAHVH